MKYVPVGERLTAAVALSELRLHRRSRWIEAESVRMIQSPPTGWAYAAFLPLHLGESVIQDTEAVVVRVWLEVAYGSVGIGFLSADQGLLDQRPVIPAPRRHCRVLAGYRRCSVAMMLKTPAPDVQLVIRNWGDFDQPSAFRITAVEVLQAYPSLPPGSEQDLGDGQWIDLDPAAPNTLEFSINNFCNLDCPFCSEGTQGANRAKQWISLEQLRDYSRIISSQQFDIVKISGGEPTLHPAFGEICQSLPELFPVSRYVLSTNGARLQKFRDCISIFDEIDLTHYPGRNDRIIAELEADLPANVTLYRKREDSELWDVKLESNLDKVRVFENCYYGRVTKVIQDRVYKCPCLLGQISNKGFTIDQVSVPLDADWRRALDQIDLEPLCRRCFMNVDAPRISGTRDDAGLSLPVVSLPRRGEQDHSLIGGTAWQPNALSTH